MAGFSHGGRVLSTSGAHEIDHPDERDDRGGGPRDALPETELCGLGARPGPVVEDAFRITSAARKRCAGGRMASIEIVGEDLVINIHGWGQR
jgi:hypothetical protein